MPTKKKPTKAEQEAAAAHAEADAMLAMHRTDPDEHSSKLKRNVAIFTVVMIIVVGLAFISTTFS